jgi:hypothetical protein
MHRWNSFRIGKIFEKSQRLTRIVFKKTWLSKRKGRNMLLKPKVIMIECLNQKIKFVKYFLKSLKFLSMPHKLRNKIIIPMLWKKINHQKTLIRNKKFHQFQVKLLSRIWFIKTNNWKLTILWFKRWKPKKFLRFWNLATLWISSEKLIIDLHSCLTRRMI